MYSKLSQFSVSLTEDIDSFVNEHFPIIILTFKLYSLLLLISGCYSDVQMPEALMSRSQELDILTESCRLSDLN